MTKKQKVIVFISSLFFTLLLALAGAIPYGYFLLALGSADSVLSLCWILYIVVAALLWLAVWRMLVLAVRHWPGRKE